MDYEDLYQIPSASVFIDAYRDDMLYRDAVWLTAHNAFANSEDGWYYTQQSMNLEHMFLNGVRSFMIDIDDYKNDLYLCHGSCDATKFQRFGEPHTLKQWLQNLGRLLNDNPKDIVTLHLECRASGESVQQLLKDINLFDNLLKNKNPNNGDLTLGNMRKNNERLVIFSDYAYERNIHDRSVYNPMGKYRGIFPTLNYKETQYSLDSYYGCEMRLDFRATPDDKNIYLFVFNHFSPISVIKDYNEINSFNKIMQRAALCSSNGYYPNFIAVDYFEQGECSNCSSTKNVVFTFNMMMSIIKTHNHSQVPILTQNLPTYSHVYNIGEYIFSKNIVNFIIYSAIDILAYTADNTIYGAIEQIHGKGTLATKNRLHTSLDGILFGIHILAESAAIYTAYNINKCALSTTAAMLLYKAPDIYKISHHSNFLISNRGLIIFPIYISFLTYQALPTILSYYKT